VLTTFSRGAVKSTSLHYLHATDRGVFSQSLRNSVGRDQRFTSAPRASDPFPLS
jgi:hypothetical protein